MFKPILKEFVTLCRLDQPGVCSLYFQNLTELCLQILIRKKNSVSDTVAFKLEDLIDHSEAKTLEWVRGLIEAAENVESFAKRHQFTKSMIYLALCEYFIRPIEVETAHPYGKMMKRDVISFPNAEKIIVR